MNRYKKGAAIVKKMPKEAQESFKHIATVALGIANKHPELGINTSKGVRTIENQHYIIFQLLAKAVQGVAYDKLPSEKVM